MINKLAPPVEATCFKEESFCEEFTIPIHQPIIAKVMDVMSLPEVLDYKLIHTKKGVSYEGQHLTGIQLLVSLKILKKLIYTAQTQEHSIHNVSCTQFKTVFVTLPLELNQTSTELLIQNKQLKIISHTQSLHTHIKDSRHVLDFGFLSINVLSFLNQP